MASLKAGLTGMSANEMFTILFASLGRKTWLSGQLIAANWFAHGFLNERIIAKSLNERRKGPAEQQMAEPMHLQTFKP